MTRRDLQLQARELGRPWDVAKTSSSPAPAWDYPSRRPERPPCTGRIALTVDGEVKQDADLSEMIWPVPDVIAFLSRFYRLHRGDVIYTGTPAGVGPVVPGNNIEVTITGLDPLNIRVGPST